MNVPINLIGSFLTLLVVAFCSSCDTISQFSGIDDVFLQKNFVWSDSSNQPFDQHIDSFFHLHENENIYAINHWQGEGVMGGASVFTILYCTKNEEGKYELEHGAIVDYLRPAKMVKETPIRSIGVLKPNNFKVSEDSKNKAVRFLYNGDLSLYKTANSIPLDRYWLRFDVKSKNSSEQVLEHVRMLAPFLQSERDLSDLMIALKPLLVD